MQLRNRAWVRRFLAAAVAVLAVLALSACGGQNSVLSTDSGGAEATLTTSRVPWDYRILEGTVGDLVGSDMTILPDNDLLPNDNNYATGDKVWMLQFMDAELTTDENQKNEVRLSSWTTLKSYPDQATAEKDLAELKVSVTTDVDLVGVYKTEYKGKTRNFAVLELPTGNRIKQPIDDERYTALKQAKTASVVLEEVHDFADYDLAYAKFRGWAN
ncbi:signal peptide protein [Paenibacillus macerans]|uniref:signal peptide protein n=1 Tax=Paenibacillus macerans TaxID=44252 RepID=UPI002E1C5D71|nr:signal peptide protein [Paenibacillus macerans]